MTSCTIYTHAYSTSSAGRFVSAKAPKGHPLSHTALIEEFRNHADKYNLEPMALVSWSDRIVDSLKRAFDKHSDGESPAEIWIAFIGVPPTTINDTTATRINSAKKLAEACKPPEPHLFFHEVVFEWAIPEKYILHQLSLQTLMKRGLEEHNFSQPSTAQVRRHTARELQGQNPKEIGYSLGSFARRFGARTPLQWVSHQLFRGCVRAGDHYG